MTTYTTTYDSPVGLLTLTADDDGNLVGLSMPDQRHRGPDDPSWVPDAAPFGEVLAELDEYFAGSRTEFHVPLAPVGTDFQRQVWAALCEIPYGATSSYGELAAHIGKPKAVRAVGLANGRNPIGIIIPCHRVIGADGSLTGYGGGLERKYALLSLEGALTAPTLPL